MDPAKLQQMLAQAQQAAQQFQQQVQHRTAEGQSGGGMVTAVVDGQGMLVKLVVDPALVKAGDVGMLQELVVAAVNDAQQNVRALVTQEMEKLAGGMGIPGFPPR